METAIEQQVTALAKVPRDIKDLLRSEQFKQAVRMALPKHLTADRFIRVAINATLRSPKLLNCNKESFFRALMDLSSYGLEPDGRRAHLIPFGSEVQLIIDYKGLVELVRRSGDVSYIHADVVYEGDEWEFRYGTEAKLVHRPNLEKRGKADARVVAVYSFVKLRDGSEDFMVLSPAEVEAVRRRSKAANNGPWVTDWAEMAKKTAFRRHSKWLPLSSEARDAVERDEEFSGIDIDASVGDVGAEGSDNQKPAPISLNVIRPAESQERPARKCGTCGQTGHDSRNCPAKETTQESNGNGARIREFPDLPDPLEVRDSVIRVKGAYWVPNEDYSAWKMVPEDEALAKVGL